MAGKQKHTGGSLHHKLANITLITPRGAQSSRFQQRYRHVPDIRKGVLKYIFNYMQYRTKQHQAPFTEATCGFSAHR